MRILQLILCVLLLPNIFVGAQQPGSAVKDAYLITRMAEKFHFQPRLLNDEFSSDIFTRLLTHLDEQKIFFTLGDIKALSGFRFALDEQISARQSAFLSALTKIYEVRIAKADTMIDNICSTPFNFSLPEKITVAEDTSYPADEKSSRTKLYKLLKSYALSYILENGQLTGLTLPEQQKYTAGIEAVARRKAQKAFKHSVSSMLYSAGGTAQAIGNEYCKAIAVCYDPHTEYFPATEKEDFESHLGREKVAFGFAFKEGEDGSLKIENILPGSPAFKSGQINKGDKLLSVQWEGRSSIDVSSAGIEQLANVLHMSNHDKATVKIKKQDGSEREVVLVKEKIEEEDDEGKVKSFLLKGSKTVGFISLPSFYQDWENESDGLKGCANDVAKEILKLRTDNIQGLIIDLRYNGGGSMQEAIELSGIFIDAGPVGQYKGKGGKTYTLKDVSRGTVYDGPLVLMVNGYSASASEVVAGALQDYHRAVVVGTPTYGKATAQVVLPLDTTIVPGGDISNIRSDSYLKVTVSQLYRVSGSSAQATGVQPDILLPDMPPGNMQRESDNPHVLVSSPLEANKYFKPYPVLDLDNLRKGVEDKIASSYYFQKLKNYFELEKAGAQNKEVSLKFQDAVEEEMISAKKSIDTASEKMTKTPYAVQSNGFKKSQLQLSESLSEMNAQWTDFLSSDPYLKIAYDVILLMIK